jgi:steroid Delta-isomerase
MNGILEKHVALLNRGVENGNFLEMISRFTDDAVMRFEGVAVGPFIGKEAIASAYRNRPPDDKIVILSEKQAYDPYSIIAEYTWSKSPRVRAGEMKIALRGQLISELVVTFDR